MAAAETGRSPTVLTAGRRVFVFRACRRTLTHRRCRHSVPRSCECAQTRTVTARAWRARRHWPRYRRPAAFHCHSSRRPWITLCLPPSTLSARAQHRTHAHYTGGKSFFFFSNLFSVLVIFSSIPIDGRRAETTEREREREN